MVAQPASHAAPQSMSVEAWRELERTSHDRKHEYINGQVYAMAGGSLDHSQTSINVVLVLRGALGRGPCRVYNSDAAARLSPTRYTYPDATVTCDERDRGGVIEIQAPRVIVVVLSPDSTEGYDRGRKFGYYRACPTVQEYVLVATDHRRWKSTAGRPRAGARSRPTDQARRWNCPASTCASPSPRFTS